jgi:hypothetical protein
MTSDAEPPPSPDAEPAFTADDFVQWLKSVAKAGLPSSESSGIDAEQYVQAIDAGVGCPTDLVNTTGLPRPDDLIKYSKYAVADFLSRLYIKSITVPERLLLALQANMLFHNGFYTAILRYANDLKNVPEAAAILKEMNAKRTAAQKRAKKATAARKAKHKPKQKGIRHRFRELRKKGFNKTDARHELAREYGKSFRQVERDTRGMA